ncbi:MAG: hypothetical protein EZS28_005540 [Streblomastix strix]|uniref:Uncharacterized protein n=1 Tax=Streblomastix strix TaxID=222440 RepID=A0A5J4WVG6_9EUKA|nr:MAG: hypothetical protein EZS28_005540 [Streblomastix strix]
MSVQSDTGRWFMQYTSAMLLWNAGIQMIEEKQNKHDTPHDQPKQSKSQDKSNKVNNNQNSEIINSDSESEEEENNSTDREILHCLSRAIQLDISAIYVNTTNSQPLFRFVSELEDNGIDGSDPDSITAANLSILSSYLYLIGQQREEALEELTEALDKVKVLQSSEISNEDDRISIPSLHYLRAGIYSSLGKYNEAQIDFETSVALALAENDNIVENGGEKEKVQEDKQIKEKEQEQQIKDKDQEDQLTKDKVQEQIKEKVQEQIKEQEQQIKDKDQEDQLTKEKEQDQQIKEQGKEQKDQQIKEKEQEDEKVGKQMIKSNKEWEDTNTFRYHHTLAQFIWDKRLNALSDKEETKDIEKEAEIDKIKEQKSQLENDKITEQHRNKYFTHLPNMLRIYSLINLFIINMPFDHPQMCQAHYTLGALIAHFAIMKQTTQDFETLLHKLKGMGGDDSSLQQPSLIRIDQTVFNPPLPTLTLLLEQNNPVSLLGLSKLIVRRGNLSRRKLGEMEKQDAEYKIPFDAIQRTMGDCASSIKRAEALLRP